MLSARYHQLRDRALSQVDRVFAEPVKLAFMKDGALDPDRETIQIEAVLRVGESKETAASGRITDNAWRSKFAGNPSELHIDRARHPAVAVRQGDRVKALSRPGEPWFEVLSVQDRGETRLVLTLGEV